MPSCEDLNTGEKKDECTRYAEEIHKVSGRHDVMAEVECVVDS